MHSWAAQVSLPFRKVLRHSLLEPFLRAEKLAGPVHVGWGLKPSGRWARRRAKGGGRLLLLEDAFVRSLKPGAGAVYGILADSKGMHYDAAGGSDLDEALQTGKPCGWMRERVGNDRSIAEVMERFRRLEISKYNWFPGKFAKVRLPERQGILVVDQTRGDAAIRFGGMVEGDFDRMLRAAFEECEGAPVYLRGHPDHLHRAKKSCFSAKLLSDARIAFLPPDLPPAAIFPLCSGVFTGTSLMGMEALIHGRRVVTFGTPFYAGRGLTEDRGGAEAKRSVGIEELFSRAYLEYCHYFDPDTHERCDLWNVMDHIELQMEMFGKNARRCVTIGFDPWKRKLTAPFLRSPGGSVKHASAFGAGDSEGDGFVTWGRKLAAPKGGMPLVRMEDGFLRSKGLGAAFHAPYSAVVDERGIYFDSGAPSDLEVMLEAGFSAEEKMRGEEFAVLLKNARLTKYNLGAQPVFLDPSRVRGRKVIFIPGQVENDASIRFGSPEVRTNEELIRRVRESQPDAYLVHKIHPDLVDCVRHGILHAEAVRSLCDEVVSHGNVLDWLALCDEVHTMTSTTGFEALVRGVRVVTYGMPFYAGWGLTIDRLECPRRTRRLTLGELVYGAMICYPRYVNPATGEFTTAEKVVGMLSAEELPVDRRAWYLKCILGLKRKWVRKRRGT